MKNKSLNYISRMMLVWFGCALGAFAQGTAFTYQGRLTDGGAAANGTYDLTFTVFNASSGGATVGASNVINDRAITNGLFTVTLDPGLGAFDGSLRWLEIAVRPGASVGAYTNLAARQPITASPYAIFAGNVSAAGISGTIPAGGLGGTYGNPVTLNNPANSFTGNGGGLSNLNAASLAGTVPALALSNAWKIAGNAGTTSNHFLGTTDNQPVEIRVNGTRVLRLEPNPNAPNVIGGYFDNLVSNGVYGATIAGGGDGGYGGNTAGGNFATVGGGTVNASSGFAATVAGGFQNTSSGDYATVGGGKLNASGGFLGTVGGGERNTNSGLYSTVGGGLRNLSSTSFATVGGGVNNTSGGTVATVSGGNNNTSSGSEAAVGGGAYNTSSSNNATVGGGFGNKSSGSGATVGGGVNNTSSGSEAAVGGGINNTSSGFAATISGGEGNIVSGDYATVSGGVQNTNGGSRGTISGGSQNTNGGSISTIGGGSQNTASGDYAMIPGGRLNVATHNAFAAGNRAKANHQGAFVWADSQDADFASTANNQFLIRAAGGTGINKTNPATALDVNGTITATSFSGTGAGLTSLNAANLVGAVPVASLTSVPASSLIGSVPAAALTSVPAASLTGSVPSASLTSIPATNLTGIIADARHSTNVALLNANQTFTGSNTIASTGSLSFGSQVRQMINLWGTEYGIGVQSYTSYFRTDFEGGFAWYQGGTHNDGKTNAGGGQIMMRLDSAGNLFTAGTLNPPSDRNLKENFATVNPREVLDKVAGLAISRWNFKGDAATPHVGPMAQDFHAAFGLGTDERHIATVDADGVALAAIQGLNQKLNEKDAEIQGLKQSMAELMKLVQALAEKK